MSDSKEAINENLKDYLEWTSLKEDTLARTQRLGLPIQGMDFRYSSYGVVFTLGDPVSKLTPGIVAHECFHVLDMLREDFDIVEKGSKEFHAYMLTWLVDEVHTFLGRHIQKPPAFALLT